jgi:hypothetical protein
MAASQLRIEYRAGVVTVGPRSAATATETSSTPSRAQPERPGAVSTDVNEIVRLVRAQLANENTPPGDAERLLQQVRAMIDQSEQRQHRELALRLAQLTGEVDAQHRLDLARLQQDFGRQQEATMEYLVRTSGEAK